MITKDNLREYANKLMFEMKEDEYDTLEKEFEVILRQMSLIDKIEGIKDVEPMTFPFEYDEVILRQDVVNNTITIDDLLINAKEVENNQIKVPKVVE